MKEGTKVDGGTMSYATNSNRFAIQTFSLSRKFEDLVAVNGIDLSIKEGELFSLLGPNGAGKTTAIKILCCLLRPSSGTATICKSSGKMGQFRDNS